MINRLTASEQETVDAGHDLGRTLRAGQVVLLHGPLGAGKTAFVRGMAGGLGCDPDAVSSPTFTIVQDYPGRTRLQHVDLYRLSSKEADDLALDDLFEGSVTAIEWPERWDNVPPDAIEVTLEVTGASSRRVTIVGAGSYRDSTR